MTHCLSVLSKPHQNLCIGMEVSSSSGLKHDIEEKALKGLLDAFGSVFTLQEIALAYCNAGRNVDLAGEILYDQRASTSTCTTHSSIGEAGSKESSELSNDNISQNPHHVSGKLRSSRTKWRPVSGGTISSVIGKEYVKCTQPANGSCIATKPLKLDPNDLSMSEIWGEEDQPNPSKDDHLQKDMEDFLFKLLGEGFQLNRDVIREVLDSCGYDMQKSMSKLLDHSAETSDKRTKFLDKSTEKFTDTCENSEGLNSERKLQQLNSSGGSGNGDSNKNGGELPRQQKEINELQKEVLAALFSATEKSEELPKRIEKRVRMSRVFGTVVTEPPRDFIREHKTNVVHLQQDSQNTEDEEDGYQALRKAVMEYRGTMKEYYKAAVDAFAKGDRLRAGKLLEQGHFFLEKARQADEESNQKIFETRIVETENDMLLDLHDHGAKEAIRLLKCHLSSLSGIPSIKYLKVVIETNDEDTTKGARRRLVMKLLERESIEWIEEGNTGTILICTDKINPKRLSFAKK